MSSKELYYGTSGPPDAKIVLVGESWGEQEARQQKPFVGASGHELDRMLYEAGIKRDEVLCTNVIAEKPYANETFRFFLPKNTLPQPRRVGGLIPSSLVESEVKRLYMQLADRPRSLVIAAGNWSFGSLSGGTNTTTRGGAEIVRESNGRRVPEEIQTYVPNGIMNWRGSMLFCEAHSQFGVISQIPLLPIIHPAAIMRAWYFRSPTLHDLKTRVPMALSNDWRPKEAPRMLAPPSFDETIGQLTLWLRRAATTSFDLASDIETIRHEFISCMGFADSASFALSIPFVSGQNFDGFLASYWTTDQEAAIIKLIRRILSHPNIRIVGQNFIYDTQFIQHWLGITPRSQF